MAVAARRDDKIAEVASEIAAAGGQAIRVALDVTNRESIADAFETVEREVGTVTVLVNNAGIAQRDMALDITEDHWNQVIGTNLTGGGLSLRRRLDVWSKVKSAVVSYPLPQCYQSASAGDYALCRFKAGVAHMTRALAVEWAQHGIRVTLSRRAILRRI